MNIKQSLTALLVCAAFAVQVQSRAQNTIDSTATAVSDTGLAPTGAAPVDSAYTVVARDGNQKLWPKLSRETNAPTGDEVIYPDAFSDFQADVIYQNRVDRLEQMVILRQQLPSPAVWGLSEESSFFQVLTEFIDPPEPKITQSLISGVIDEHLDFG